MKKINWYEKNDRDCLIKEWKKRKMRCNEERSKREIKFKYRPEARLYLPFDLQLFAGTAWYVRQGAGGSNNGTDWTNAWTDMTQINWSSVARGDTIYVSDGDYSAPTLTKAVSGTTLIEIRKACSTGVGDGDHGTETGWSYGYGDGSANWTSTWSVQTGYWKFNGVKRSLNDWYDNSAYGFRYILPTAGKVFNGSGSAGCIVQYVYTRGILNGHDGGDSFYSTGSSDDWLLSHCFSERGGRTIMLWNYSDYMTLEYSIWRINRSEGGADPNVHGEILSTTQSNHFRFKYNIFEDGEGTMWLGTWDFPTVDNLYYGNIFHLTSKYPNTGQTGQTVSEGIIGCTTSDGSWFTGIRIYNNTFIGFENFSTWVIWQCEEGGTNDVIAKNNLFINSGTNLFNGVSEHDYNGFSGSNNHGETHPQTGLTTAIFVNYLAAGMEDGADFHLSGVTNAGVTLASPYDVDMDGVTRGADGVWDRGAYEYDSGAGSIQPNIYDAVKVRESVESRIASYYMGFARVE